MLTSSSDAVSDFEASIEDIFAEGDKVAVRWAFRATYKGEVGPGSPTLGERFSQAAISIYPFVNGKIEDDWGRRGSANIAGGVGNVMAPDSRNPRCTQ